MLWGYRQQLKEKVRRNSFAGKSLLGVLFPENTLQDFINVLLRSSRRAQCYPTKDFPPCHSPSDREEGTCWQTLPAAFV